ncbi:MAG TPA: hypothetical protein DFS52_02800 [Myxococcales bacterium]|nr:hypothetical protein [Myxococcales bacterium]
MPRPPSFADLDAALAALGPRVRRARPRRGIVALLSEARRLYTVVEPLRERYAILPDFDLAALDKLPELVARAQSAEVDWANRNLASAQVSMSGLRDEAIALRFRLVKAARVVFSGDEKKLRLLDGVPQRRDLPRLVGDLRRLAKLIDARAEDFARVPRLPASPADEARRIAQQLTAGRYDPALVAARERRDAAVALMELAVKEVRCAGRYLFRHEPRLLRSIVSKARRGGRKPSAKK